MIKRTLTVVMLAALLWAAPASATFPGENGKLTFERSQIFTREPERVGPDCRSRRSSGGSWGDEPAVSPDGRLIAFDYAGGPAGQDGWGIWVMSNTGTNPHQVTRQSQAVAGQDTYPFWSPDGQQIGFVRDRDILVMNADGERHAAST